MAKKKKQPEQEVAPAEPPPSAEELGLENFQAPPVDEGLSLDKLSSAFAEMLGGGDDPYSAPEEPAEAVPDPAADVAKVLAAEPTEEDRDAACEISPVTILEAMLFVGDPENAPIEPQWVASLMRGVRPAEIESAARELNDRYRAENRPYEIVSEGKGYRLALRADFRALRDKVYGRDRAVKLTEAAVEVLAVVAYHGSLTAEEVNKYRGKPSGALLKQLLRRQLLRLERPEGTAKKNARFSPTRRFLDLFGLSGLEDLPRVQDVERR
jgi:segregation and condensation protein B